MIELARWGMDLQKLEDVIDLAPSSLPNALRVILRPPADAAVDARPAQRRPVLRAAHRATAGSTASRGDAREPDLTLSGTPIDVIAALVVGEAGEAGVEIDGDRELLERAALDGRHPRAPARGSAGGGAAAAAAARYCS